MRSAAQMSLKSDILAEFEKNRGRDVSGQLLAEKLGVTRSAVSKAVAALRADGYDITSVTNRGYRLSGDALSESGLRLFLPAKYRGINICVLRETDSTNNEAKRMLASGICENSLIISDTQTSGRGRRGREFWSPSGVGIYMTLLINVDVPIADAVSITTMTAVAAADAIEHLTGLEVGIKWVNDLYLGDKKICGILTEASSDFEAGTTHSVIVGIGLNVSQGDVPDELADIVGSLSCDGVTRNELAAEIAGRVLALSEDMTDKSYMARYRARSNVIGRRITFTRGDDVIPAEAVSIDDEGGLVVRRENGETEILRSGEITVRFSPV